MNIPKLHAVLFDPKAPVRITHEIDGDKTTITVDVESPDPPGYEILASVAVTNPEAATALRATTAMLFFPHEIARANEMLGALKITFSKDGAALSAEEAGRVLRNDLHGKKD